MCSIGIQAQSTRARCWAERCAQALLKRQERALGSLRGARGDADLSHTLLSACYIRRPTLARWPPNKAETAALVVLVIVVIVH